MSTALPPLPQEQENLQRFEQSHTDLNAELDQLIATVRQRNANAFQGISSAELWNMVQRLAQWEGYYQQWLPAAQHLNGLGRPDLLHRLQAVQSELSQCRAIFQKMFDDQRTFEFKAFGIAVKSQNDWFQQAQAMHQRTQAAYDHMNQQWSQQFNRR